MVTWRLSLQGAWEAASESLWIGWIYTLDGRHHVCMTPDLTGLWGLAGARFVPKPEERLLSVVHALLHRCYKLPFSDAADVPDSLRNELSGKHSMSNACCACCQLSLGAALGAT